MLDRMIPQAGRNLVLLSMLFFAACGMATAAISPEVGPYVQFTGPDSALVRWDTSSNSNSIVGKRSQFFWY